MIEAHKDRSVITLSGPEAKNMLQGIITNNVEKLSEEAGLYAALLTPQGKYLHDFFLMQKDNAIYLDCDSERMPDLFRRLLMYRLRSNVEIIDRSEDFNIITSTNPISDGYITVDDPRHPTMGYRAIRQGKTNTASDQAYHHRRITLGIAEGAHDFIPEKSTILEGYFEQINGVDFKKGCYVGQEVIARMKYRGKIKKTMLPVTLSGPAPAFGSEITNEKGNKIGDLRSNCGKNAIALFRQQDVAYKQEYTCCGIKVTPHKPVFLEDSDNE